MGPAPLSWSDIQAWARLLQTQPMPIEVEIIMQIDGVWLETVTAASKNKEGAR